MSGISSGIGLISGINTADLIDQLMAIERRPIDRLQLRISALDSAKTAFLSLSARLLAMRNTGVRFGDESFFNALTASSSNEDVLTVSVQRGAPPGTYNFRVHALATHNQVVSRGFVSADSTPVGVGSMTFEGAQARVNPSTELSTLNGGNGVGRGIIEITDRNGDSAEINLAFAQSIDDVLRAINSANGIEVRARVTSLEENGATGDRIVIEDLTGLSESKLIVRDVGGGSMAADLGIAGSVDADRIDGKDLVYLTDSTPLSQLNDGLGIDRFVNVIGDDIIFEIDENGNGQKDSQFGVSLSGNLARDTNTRLEALNQGRGVRLGTIRITDRAGNSVDVDLDERKEGAPIVKTAADVVKKINKETDAAGVKVSISISNSNFLLTDTSDPPDDTAVNFKVEDISGFAAADLGFADDVGADSIVGKDIYSITTLGDVIRAINLAEGNDARVVARISESGSGITLSTSKPLRKVTVTGATVGGISSGAAEDLGIVTDKPFGFNTPHVSRDLVSGLDTVLLRALNGGSGVEELGKVQFSDRAGKTTLIDLTDAVTLQDVIDLINAGLGGEGQAQLRASINLAGHGIVIVDESGQEGIVEIKDVTGTTAGDLGIAGRFAPGEGIDGGNLQRQYIARGTLLSELNGGRGISSGDFRITAADGTVGNVTIGDHLTTIGQIIDRINAAAPKAFSARINDTGDGILIEDISGGDGVLSVVDVGGGITGSDLRLVGSSKPGQEPPVIDGSYEVRIDIDANDTLNDIRDKINEAGGGISASIVNIGGDANSFSLAITSDTSGRAGEMIIDSGGIDLGLRTMARAQDALVTFGGDAPGALLIASSTNVLDEAITGVSLNLLDVDDADIVVTIAQDVDSIVDGIQQFVDDYNETQSLIDQSTRFDADALTRAVLFGDAAVSTVRTRLHGAVTAKFDGVDERFSRLLQVGLTIGANNRLEFDKEDFLEAYEKNPQLVEQLFTQEDTGFGDVLIETLDGLTDSVDGVIPRRTDLLDNQRELLNSRIAALTDLLGRKRTRLERQFIGLEIALAGLQRQQGAISVLQSQLLG